MCLIEERDVWGHGESFDERRHGELEGEVGGRNPPLPSPSIEYE
jgi:hypothetical protein